MGGIVVVLALKMFNSKKNIFFCNKNAQVTYRESRMEIVDFFTFFIRQSVNQACTYKNGESLDFTSTVTFTESSDNFLHFFVAEMRKPLYRETPIKMLIYADQSFGGTVISNSPLILRHHYTGRFI